MNKQKMTRFWRDERGANMVEYLIIVGLVAIAAMFAFKTFGGTVNTKITNQGTTLGAVDDTSSGGGGSSGH
jgi:pilus assembly protein Flp/PilA